MVKVFLVMLVVLLCKVSNCFSQPAFVKVPNEGYVSFFIFKDTLIFHDECNTRLLISTNTGYKWFFRNLPAPYKQIYFMSSNNGWGISASAGNYVLWRTIDGGQYWDLCFTFPSDFTPIYDKNVTFYDDRTYVYYEDMRFPKLGSCPPTSQTNKDPTPPGRTDKDPTPPGRTDKDPTPPGRTDKDPTPPGRTDKDPTPLGHEGEIEKPFVGFSTFVNIFVNQPYILNGKVFYTGLTLPSPTLPVFQLKRMYINLNLVNFNFYNTAQHHTITGLTLNYIYRTPFIIYAGFNWGFVKENGFTPAKPFLPTIEIVHGYRILPFKTKSNSDGYFTRVGVDIMLSRTYYHSQFNPLIIKAGLCFLVFEP